MKRLLFVLFISSIPLFPGVGQCSVSKDVSENGTKSTVHTKEEIYSNQDFENGILLAYAQLFVLQKNTDSNLLKFSLRMEVGRTGAFKMVVPRKIKIIFSDDTSLHLMADMLENPKFSSGMTFQGSTFILKSSQYIDLMEKNIYLIEIIDHRENETLVCKPYTGLLKEQAICIANSLESEFAGLDETNTNMESYVEPSNQTNLQSQEKNNKALNIYERAANQAKDGGNRLFYTEYPLATSGAFAYLHNEYTPRAYNKIAYFVNTEDTKTLDIIQNELTEAGLNVVDFFKMGCTNCNDPASIRAFLKSQGVDCILQITLASERVKGTSVTTNFYQFYGVMTATSRLHTWLDVFTVFEWYNEDFEDIPFLKSEVLKTSGRKFGGKNLFYGLLEGNVVILSRRTIKKGLLIPKKKGK